MVALGRQAPEEKLGSGVGLPLTSSVVGLLVGLGLRALAFREIALRWALLLGHLRLLWSTPPVRRLSPTANPDYPGLPSAKPAPGTTINAAPRTTATPVHAWSTHAANPTVPTLDLARQGPALVQPDVLSAVGPSPFDAPDDVVHDDTRAFGKEIPMGPRGEKHAGLTLAAMRAKAV